MAALLCSEEREAHMALSSSCLSFPVLTLSGGVCSRRGDEEGFGVPICLQYLFTRAQTEEDKEHRVPLTDYKAADELCQSYFLFLSPPGTSKTLHSFGPIWYSLVCSTEQITPVIICTSLSL